MSRIEIVTVSGKRDMNIFLELPREIYKDFPLWVQPLKSEERTLLTPGEHPFWENAERELFLALRDGRPVGRIAAIEDRNANTYQHVAMCVWGFFECENDPEAAGALLDAVSDWGKARGLTFLRGPMNPSTNYTIGLLHEGFDQAPVIMMPWNPPYYIDLMLACGMHKEKDVVTFYIDRDTPLPDWVQSMARRIRDRGEITIRTGNMSRLREEVQLMVDIYNDCWKNNWGFVPMTEAECSRMAKELKPIIREEMAFFIYHRDQPIACGLILPDFNPVLRRFKGKLGLASLINMVLYRKEITGCRTLLFGVRDEYKKLGVPLLAFQHVLEYSEEALQYKWMEMGWLLEDNRDVIELVDDFGGRQTKTYRLWRREI